MSHICPLNKSKLNPLWRVSLERKMLLKSVENALKVKLLDTVLSDKYCMH